MNIIKDFSLKEEIANSVLHGIGAILSIIFLVLLIIKSVTIGTAWHIVSYTIFGSTLIILYTMSTIYHSLPNGTAKEYRIDMCAIDRYGGFVQFKSNGKYIILQGTISLEERWWT